jgi:hypothetical protein
MSSSDTLKLLQILEMLREIKTEIAQMKHIQWDKTLEIKKILQDWQKADHIRLHAGEMTWQEMRTSKAIVKAIEAQIMRVIGHE